MEKFIKLTAVPASDIVGPIDYINPKMIIGMARNENENYTTIFTNKWMYKVAETPEEILDKIQNL